MLLHDHMSLYNQVIDLMIYDTDRRIKGIKTNCDRYSEEFSQSDSRCIYKIVQL